MTKDIIVYLESLKGKIPDVAKEAILENKGVIVNLVKYNQLSRGINSSGRPLAKKKGRGSGYYAKATERIAKSEGVRMPKIAGSPYNFAWSGDTLDGMYLKAINISRSNYEIYSRTSKAKLLEDIYGEIFDLTEEHNEWVNKNILEPYISAWISDKILSYFV